MKFTTKSVAGLHLPKGKTDYVVFDDDLPGFGIRLREGGSRNWVFQYALGTKQRRMSLGSATAISLVKARETASELHAKVRLGQDPAGQKAQSKQHAAETFEAVALVYLAARKPKMRPGAYDQIDRHLLKYAKPLHRLQLVGIDQRTIATLINQISNASGEVQANRARSSLLAFYGWAMRQGIVTQNPVANTGRFSEKPRTRTLTDNELRVIWNEAGDDHYGCIVKLLMLTGQRADEIASLRWTEIGADTITLPPERLKNKGGKDGLSHEVPLSDPALAILAAQSRRIDGNGELRDCVFGTGQGGFSGWSKSKERLDERIAKAAGKPLPHWTIHDLRRTAATVMAESPCDPKERRDPNKRYGLGVLPHVVEAILNHISGHKGGVAGVYNHASYGPQKRQALNLWADHLMALVVGTESNITMLRRV
jgi:integrase